MLCHGEVYRRRPAPARLTEFYLCVSFGGVLGGIFAALIAPHIFSRIYEYPILIAGGAARAARHLVAGGIARISGRGGPGAADRRARRRCDSSSSTFACRLRPNCRSRSRWWLLVGVDAAAAPSSGAVVSLVVLAFVLTGLWQPGFNRIETARSFFGVHQVVETADGRHRLLYHGTTIHGAERCSTATAPAKSPPEPLTYYYFGGPISQGIEAVRAARKGARPRRRRRSRHRQPRLPPARQGGVDVLRDRSGGGPDRARSALLQLPVGLRARCSDRARRCAARRSRRRPQRYDLIVLDAFSSDAIPVHLLTREALAGYLARLAPTMACW